MLNGFRVCGNMNYDSMNKIVSANRIRTMTKQGIIRRTSYQNLPKSKSKNEYTYRLTKKGMTLCKSQGMKHFEKKKGNERHQTEVGKKYASLSPSEQQSCKNAFDQKEMLYDKAYLYLENGNKQEHDRIMEELEKVSYIDLIYTTTIDNTSVQVGFEVITSFYLQETIIAHQYSATEILHCTTYETINIH